jgi:hypothetical protein
LRSLPSKQPATKIGQLNWVWSEIEESLAIGIKLKEVWEAARKDGLEMSYAHFRVCISRIRRRRQRFSQNPQPLTQPYVRGTDLPDSAPSDPFRNLRELREKKKQAVFDYDPLAMNKDLIE